MSLIGIRYQNQRLDDLLVRERVIGPRQSERARAHAQTSGIRLVQAIMELDYAGEDTIVRVLTAAGFPHLMLSQYELDTAEAKFVPEHLARSLACVPVHLNGGVLNLAMADCADHEAVEYLSAETGRSIHRLVSHYSDIQQAIQALYSPSGKATPGRNAKAGGREGGERRQTLRVSVRMPVLIDGRSHGAYVVDVSANGVRLSIEDLGAVSSCVIVQFRVPDGEQLVPMICRTEILRMTRHEASNGNHYELGGRFVDLPDHHRGLLSEFLERQASRG